MHFVPLNVSRMLFRTSSLLVFVAQVKLYIFCPGAFSVSCLSFFILVVKIAWRKGQRALWRKGQTTLRGICKITQYVPRQETRLSDLLKTAGAKILCRRKNQINRRRKVAIFPNLLSFKFSKESNFRFAGIGLWRKGISLQTAVKRFP